MSPAVISAIVYVALVLWVAGLSLAVITLNERTQRAVVTAGTRGHLGCGVEKGRTT